MDMNAEALSYYWHLRAQDIAPDTAREHVRQRFGVTIGKVMPAAESVDFSGPDWQREALENARNTPTIFGCVANDVSNASS